MSDLFLKILNMSISATYIALLVMLFRLLLKKAPKKVNIMLWLIVALRLTIPFSIESVFSLIPSAETVSPSIIYSEHPTIYSGFPALNSVVNPVISESFSPNAGDSVNPLQVWTFILSHIWILGIGLMLIWFVISCVRIKKSVREAEFVEADIYQSSNAATPFVFGFLSPKIYLPKNISESSKKLVVAHEKTHIKGFDHIIKPIGFIILAIHWFNPVVWISYILFCKDIELSCDEKVIKNLNKDERADYSQAMLMCSVPSFKVNACPLAFGTVSIKNRVKNVLNYKKPALWIIIISIIVIIALVVCFLTNPKGMRLVDINDSGVHITDLDNVNEIIIDNRSTDEYDMALIKNTLMELRISKNPISNNRSDDRPCEKQIYLKKDGQSFTLINFSQDLSAVWINNGVKPTLSYRVLNPDILENVFLKRLTLNDVIELSKKKDALSRADFSEYYHIETGSGLYIEMYPINDMFSLSIGLTSANIEEKPFYIYLSAADGQDTMVDIRYGDVEKYINEHKDNLVVKQHTFAFSSCAVGYNEEINNFMFLISEKKEHLTLSSRRYLPYITVSSKNELDEFIHKTSELFNFDLAYEDTPPLKEAIKKYDEEFFKSGNTLIIAYDIGSTTAERFHVRRLSTVGNAIFEAVIESNNPEVGDTAMEGWLILIDCGDIKLSDYQNVYVHRE